VYRDVDTSKMDIYKNNSSRSRLMKHQLSVTVPKNTHQGAHTQQATLE